MAPGFAGTSSRSSPSDFKLCDRLKGTEASLQEKKSLGSKILSILPILSFFVGCAGVSFQIFVLYPWHEELSAEFKSLEQAITKLDITLIQMNEDGEIDPKTRNKVKIEAMNLQRDTDKYIQGHTPPRSFL